MRLRSMTGYGRGEATRKGTRVVVELSTVNRKQLDVHISLPRGLAGLDARVTEEVQGALSRGRINGEVVVDFGKRPLQEGIQVNQELAAAYVKSLRGAAAKLNLQDDLSVSHLLTLPNVVRFENPQADPEEMWPVMVRALRQALKALVAMREQEGKALGVDLEARLAALEANLEHIRTRAPKVAEKYREGLFQRLKQAGVSVADADDRLLREVALFADRADICEELSRLESHLNQARKLMKGKATTGKSLDFLAQEMFREINTIGSKANDSRIAQRVVQCKTELERFREQVQNVE